MLPFCAACLLQIFLGSDPVWGLTFYLQASMQNDKKAGDPSTNMDGSPTICQYYLGAMRSITANALDFGYAGRNISCVRNAEIQPSQKNASNRPFWAIWSKSKPEGNLPSRRSQSCSHTAHIQSTQDSLRCTFITAICSVGSKNGSTRRACRRTCEKRS